MLKAKRKLVILLCTISVLIMAGSLFACNNTHKINFIVDGATYLTTEYTNGESFSLPTSPTKENHTFGGWYFDNTSYIKNLTKTTFINEKFDADVTVYARWVPYWNGTSCSTNLNGNGSVKTPYLINSPSDLVYLTKQVEGGNKFTDLNFELTCDLNLNNNEWTPIGLKQNLFEGNFNGNGYTVSNFVINGSTKNAGLFGGVKGKITNLKVVNFNYDLQLNSTMEIGGVVGYLWGVGNNLQAQGIINVNNIQTSYVGGAVGYLNEGDLRNIKSNVHVVSSSQNSTQYLGGVVGYVNGGQIQNVVNMNSVKVHLQNTTNNGISAFSGGIAGYGTNVNIKNAKNNAQVECLSVAQAEVSVYCAGIIASMFENSSVVLAINNGLVVAKTLSQNLSFPLSAAGIVGEAIGSNITNCVVNNGISVSCEATLQNVGMVVGKAINVTVQKLVYANGVPITNSNNQVSNNEYGEMVNCSRVLNITYMAYGFLPYSFNNETYITSGFVWIYTQNGVNLYLE